jgi:lipopolysaccharide transport system permease protein
VNLALIGNFVRQELKDRYAGSLLGGFWAFITPLLNILMFALIFSQLMGARVPGIQGEFQSWGYSIYLISGILPWAAMSSSVVRIMGVYRDKAALLGKVHLSLSAFPISILCVEAFVFAVSLGFFFLLLLAIGFPVAPTWVAIIPVFLLQQLFAFGLGLLLAVLSVFLEDLRELVPVLMQFWFWLTPIVYVLSILPDRLASLLRFNPFFPLANAYRSIVLLGHWPDISSLLPLAGFAVFLLGSAFLLLHRLERDIRDFL